MTTTTRFCGAFAPTIQVEMRQGLLIEIWSHSRPFDGESLISKDSLLCSFSAPECLRGEHFTCFGTTADLPNIPDCTNRRRAYYDAPTTDERTPDNFPSASSTPAGRNRVGVKIAERLEKPGVVPDHMNQPGCFSRFCNVYRTTFREIS